MRSEEPSIRSDLKCVCLCVCPYVHGCVYVHTSVWVCVCEYTCLHVCAHVCAGMFCYFQPTSKTQVILGLSSVRLDWVFLSQAHVLVGPC